MHFVRKDTLLEVRKLTSEIVCYSKLKLKKKLLFKTWRIHKKAKYFDKVLFCYSINCANLPSPNVVTGLNTNYLYWRKRKIL